MNCFLTPQQVKSDAITAHHHESDDAVKNDPASFAAALKIVFHRIVRLANEHGATLRQFVLDDKGFVAILVFGLPPNMHEDDASRALRIATILQQERPVVQTKKTTSGYLGPTRIGITSGTCFCGPIGLRAVRQEFAVVGDAVNLAARLMSKCDSNQIRCDLATAQAAMANGWTFDEQEAYTPKGKNEPVRSFVPSNEGKPQANKKSSFAMSFDAAHHHPSAPKPALLRKQNSLLNPKADPVTSEMAELMSLVQRKPPLIGHETITKAIGEMFIARRAWPNRLAHEKAIVKSLRIEGRRGEGKSIIIEHAEQTFKADAVVATTVVEGPNTGQPAAMRSSHLRNGAYSREAPRPEASPESNGNEISRGIRRQMSMSAVGFDQVDRGDQNPAEPSYHRRQLSVRNMGLEPFRAMVSTHRHDHLTTITESDCTITVSAPRHCYQLSILPPRLLRFATSRNLDFSDTSDPAMVNEGAAAAVSPSVAAARRARARAQAVAVDGDEPDEDVVMRNGKSFTALKQAADAGEILANQWLKLSSLGFASTEDALVLFKFVRDGCVVSRVQPAREAVGDIDDEQDRNGKESQPRPPVW